MWHSLKKLLALSVLPNLVLWETKLVPQANAGPLLLFEIVWIFGPKTTSATSSHGKRIAHLGRDSQEGRLNQSTGVEKTPRCRAYLDNKALSLNSVTLSGLNVVDCEQSRYP